MKMAERFPVMGFLSEEEGQDMLEYTLLLAAIALAGAAAFMGMGGVVSGIWSIANNRLMSANGSTS
jgi:Flp pilus assembly pilin Flp